MTEIMSTVAGRAAIDATFESEDLVRCIADWVCCPLPSFTQVVQPYDGLLRKLCLIVVTDSIPRRPAKSMSRFRLVESDILTVSVRPHRVSRRQFPHPARF